MRSTGLTCVDLFSGVGGFSEGFRQAGIETLAAVDNDPHVARAYHQNFPEVPLVEGDLYLTTTKNRLLEVLGGRSVDVVVGGPPCQGFSIFGKRRFVNTKSYDPKSDERNDLVLAFANTVALLKPSWVVMENVPGIITLDEGEYLKSVIQKFKELGFNKVECAILNAASYGVPQVRRRLVLIAQKGTHIVPWPKEKFFDTPKGWQRPFRTVAEALTDLQYLSGDQISHHAPPKHHALVARRYSYVKQGEKLDPDSLPPDLLKGLKTGRDLKSYSKVHYRLHPERPSPTIVPGHNAFPIHPWLDRTLTIREAARLQTLPDRFEFFGPVINRGLQVGNAFPPLLAQVIAERLARVVRNG